MIKTNMTKKTLPDIQFRIDSASAENGNSSGQYALGVAFEEGLLVKQCYVRAVKWYKLAAGQNHAPAQYKLGGLYEGVIGGPDRLSIADKTEASDDAPPNSVDKATKVAGYCCPSRQCQRI